MSGNRFRVLNQWYYAGYEDANDSNDAADVIVSQPDRFLVSQDKLFELNGGYATIALALSAVAVGQAAIFMGAPRTAAHFRKG